MCICAKLQGIPEDLCTEYCGNVYQTVRRHIPDDGGHGDLYDGHNSSSYFCRLVLMLDLFLSEVLECVVILIVQSPCRRPENREGHKTVRLLDISV